MKNIALALLTVNCFLLTSCGGPRVIPDDKLVEIFRDIYLTNAIAQERYTMDFDSLSIYEPLLERRGYTSEDIQYTVGNFARRKSASISQDIVGRAIDLLHSEGSVYTRGIAARDTITRMAQERFKQRVWSRAEIAVRRPADTSRLRIVLPAKAGSYRVDFGYEVDSLDENLTSMRTYLTVRGTHGRNMGSANYRLGRAGHGRGSMEVKADTAARRLVIDLNPYPRQQMRRPRLTFDSIRVTYFLPAEVAFDSVQREFFSYKQITVNR